MELNCHPTDRGAEERSGNHISNPVVIGDDNCNTQQDNDQGADRPPARCQDPEDGGDRSGDRGRARGERVPVRRAMQQTEPVDAILNVAWIGQARPKMRLNMMSAAVAHIPDQEHRSGVRVHG
jgi:hypothetical protein